MASLRINRGTTFNIGIVFKKDGAPASLVGAEIRFTIKDKEWDDDITDDTAVVRKNVLDHTDPDNGLSVVPLEPEDTSDIIPGKYWFDIKVEEANGEIHQLIKGRCQIKGSPTNRRDD